ncbi:MAG TPA: hypothetical protein PLE10_02675 [Brevefilum sp.]|nr:hypothetical protein [Brevefilum sp.]HOR18719.1 hypothetical protein [Brevefilum sp.]HPL68620.1 hypothetical protein [Brevefilum sp.]
MQTISMLALVTIVIAVLIVIIFKDWRVIAVALGAQYLGAFALVALSWPVNLAIVKLITGWMASSVIAFTCLRQNRERSQPEKAASLFFRGLTGLLVIVLIFILAPSMQERIFPGVDLVIIQGGLMMMGMTLMQLGLNSEPYPVIISLFTFLSGFEVIHAALELSTLLTGLFVVVNLGLSLAGVYLMVSAEETSESIQEEEL